MLLPRTADIFRSAPSIAAAIHDTVHAQMEYLHSKLPPKPERLLDRPAELSKNDEAIWNKYYQIVTDPMSAVDKLAQGTLTQAHVDALGAVYPTLLAQMQEHAMERIARKARVRPQIRLSVNALLGGSVSSSMSPAGIVANQIAIAKAPKEDNKLPATPGPINKIGSERFFTQSQMAQRRSK